KSVDLGYGQDASLSFPPGITRIYNMCMAKHDTYHISLAGQCVGATLDVWNFCLSRREAEIAQASKRICDAIKDMALNFQRVETQPSFDLGDPATTLTAKMSENRVTLQDIALSIVMEPITEQWQHQSRADDVQQIIETAGKLLKNAVAKDDYFFATQYQ